MQVPGKLEDYERLSPCNQGDDGLLPKNPLHDGEKALLWYLRGIFRLGGLSVDAVLTGLFTEEGRIFQISGLR